MSESEGKQHIAMHSPDSTVRGYGQPYGERPPYERGPYSAPPPMARPPPGPPPPMPQGWHQEWEPNMRRAFWVEDATGRAQWEPPYGGPPGQGYYDGSRSVPPPEPQGGYYAPPPGPPGGYDQRGYDQGYQQPAEERKSNTGKYLAVGAGALAVGALGGAFIEHEIDEDSDKDDQREAYEQGREDQEDYDDGGW
ncbi:hypothetical protein N7526_009974 [Penicillium atrosanguineum]|nr:hypothetical protein N7526_009974 [Penicillium atrosanguineum]